MGGGYYTLSGSDPSTQQQLGEEQLPLEAPFICSCDALPLDLPVLTICLTPVLFPCYASALMACPLPSQQPSQLGNQKNVENAEVRVPPILKDPHSSLRCGGWPQPRAHPWGEDLERWA